MKISQVKLTLQEIITDINQLQSHRNGLTQDNLACKIPLINECEQRLEAAFAEIESSRKIEETLHALSQRKIKRTRRKAKVKLKKQQVNTMKTTEHQFPSTSIVLEQSSITASKKKEMKSANKYLATIKSLEYLHQLKGGNESCKIKELLHPVRSIWQSTADNINAELHNASSTETQWNCVLFGGTPEIDDKCGRKEFIERRCIWDSYLVSEHEPTGMRIPIGWVYPKEDARPEWKQFRGLLFLYGFFEECPANYGGCTSYWCS